MFFVKPVLHGVQASQFVPNTFFRFFLPSALPSASWVDGKNINVAKRWRQVRKMEDQMSTKSASKSTNKGVMTHRDAARIQSSMAKNNGGQVSKGSFSSRASRSAAKNGK